MVQTDYSAMLVAVSNVYDEVAESAGLGSLDWVLVDGYESRVITSQGLAYQVVETRCKVPGLFKRASFKRALLNTPLVGGFEKEIDSEKRISVGILVRLAY